MKTRNRKQGGFIVTIELLLLAVITVIGLIVGMTDVRDAVVAELGDLSESIGALNQSYSIDGVQNASQTASTSGSEWQDAPDTTDTTLPIDDVSNSGDAGWGDANYTPAVTGEDTEEPAVP